MSNKLQNGLIAYSYFEMCHHYSNTNAYISHFSKIVKKNIFSNIYKNQRKIIISKI